MTSGVPLDVLPGVEPERRPVLPSGRVGLVVRAVLVLLVALAALDAARQPVDRTADDLLRALDAGEVATLTIERPRYDAMGAFPVRWTGDGRPGRATYAYDSSGGTGSLDGVVDADDVVVDEGLGILAAAASSPRGVVVVEVEEMAPESTPAWRAVLGLGAVVGVVLLLVAGPRPRVATRWAWFWLIGAGWPISLAFLLVEPTPLWRRGAVPAPVRPLTGGWALLATVLLVRPLMGAFTGG